MERKYFWARCQNWSPVIRGGFLKEVSGVWKEGRVLANLKEKRSNVKAAMCQTMARRFYEFFPCPYNQRGGQLLPFIGEEIGLEGESKLIRVTQVHSFEKGILYYRGPQPPGGRLVLVCGLLGTGLQGRR